MTIMAITKSEQVAILVTILYLIPIAFCNDAIPIPADKSQVEGWFQQNVKPVNERGASLDPALAEAEKTPLIIRMQSDGSGQFRSLTDCFKSIPVGNKKRTIIHLGGGEYREKVKLDRGKDFVTLVGDPKNPPILINGGTAKQFGTFYSATLTVEAEYFSAINVHFKNSAPRPVGLTPGQQAVALRIGGDKASFYGCRFIGFQDTLCDDMGRHFYKDCYIEGTVDFIFGAGRSLYLNTEINILPGDNEAMATAQGGETRMANSGYSFVHCRVTGAGAGTGYLGRAWRQYPQVVFAFSELGDAVNPVGWSNNRNPENDKTVFYAEYQNAGPKSDLSPRYPFVRKFTAGEAKSFISLEYILGSKWLLPPVSA